MASFNGSGEQFPAQPERSADTLIPELRELPPAIQDSFLKLPSAVREKIFPRDSKQEKRSETVHIENYGLEKVVAGLDQDGREKLAQESLALLFTEGDISKIFRCTPTDKLRGKVIQFMEVLWGNRSQSSGSTIRIFGADSYPQEEERLQKLEKDRANLARAVSEKEQAVKAQQDRIEVTKKQKRLTEKKKKELLPLLGALEEAVNALKRFDSMFEIGENVRLRLRRREARERKFTETLRIITEYLASDEFATVVAEQFDRVFYIERRTTRNADGVSSTFLEQQIAQAKERLIVLEKAIQEWYLSHKDEGSMKERRKLAVNEKQLKIIEYFKQLYDSYLRGKNERNASGDKLNGEISQMNVALHLLNRAAGETS